MSDASEVIDEEILECFREEFEQISERLEALGVFFCEEPTLAHVDEAYRAVHTIKGNCYALSLTEMGVLAHRFEDLLRDHQSKRQLPSPQVGEVMLEVNDRLRDMIKDPSQPAPPELIQRIDRVLKGDPATPADAKASSASISIQEESAKRIAVEVDDLNRLFEGSESLRAHLLDSALFSVSRQAEELSRGLLAVRQVAPAALVPKLRRIVRETSKLVGKPVKFSVSGESLQADVAVVEDLAAVLPHMLRNSLDHGLEAPEDRRKTGKPEEGLIELSFRKEAGAFVVTIGDDGKGMNPEGILASAVKKGVLTKEAGAALTRYERLQLIFAPGFSTAEAVSEVSGRGVGMDVVSSNIKKHGGRIEIETEIGVGTKFELRFPVLFRWEEYFVAQVGGRLIGLPVRSVAEIHPSETAPVVEAGMAVSDREAFPVIGFSALDPDFGAERPRDLLILELAGARLALAVDDLRGFVGALIQAAPASATLPYLAGIGQSPDGDEIWGIDLDVVARDWNAYMVPE